MELTLPNLSLVVMIGCSGSGKSTFARTHFAATEILSSDFWQPPLRTKLTSAAFQNDCIYLITL